MGVDSELTEAECIRVRVIVVEVVPTQLVWLERLAPAVEVMGLERPARLQGMKVVKLGSAIALRELMPEANSFVGVAQWSERRSMPLAVMKLCFPPVAELWYQLEVNAGLHLKADRQEVLRQLGIS